MKATYGVVLGAGLLLVAADPARAQIVTDRPDFTESTVTVPDGRIQLEAGYTYMKDDELTGHQVGEALLRLGVIPGLELRAELPSYQRRSGDFGIVEVDEDGWSDPSIGMKLGLYEAGLAEGLPSLSLLLGSSIPMGDDDFGSDGWEPEAILALGWEFAPRLELSSNVGYAQREAGDRYDEFFGSVALAIPATSSIGAFIEYYAIRPDLDFGVDEDVVDGGLTFLLSPTFQLDARIGFDLAEESDAMFFGAGFSKLF